MSTLGKWIHCGKKEILTTNVEYRVNWNSEYSIRNMMTELDLIWEEDYKIGLLGSVVFFGFLISNFTIMPTSDSYEKKPVLIIVTVLSTFSAFLILFTKSLTMIYSLLFIHYRIWSCLVPLNDQNFPEFVRGLDNGYFLFSKILRFFFQKSYFKGCLIITAPYLKKKK